MLTMDWASSGHLFEGSNSQNTRTRPNRVLSTREASFLHSSRLAESPKDEFEPGAFISSSSRPPSPHGLASPACISDDPNTFLSSPNSCQEQVNQPQSTLVFARGPSTLHGSWFDTPRPSNEAHPQVRISPAANNSELPQSGSPTSHSQVASMSTVAVQYSSTFDMAGKAPFSWPVMDSHNMLGHDLGSYSAATGLPPPGAFSRSATGSPPRMFTAEQRELKRQQDQARRDSKISQRQRSTGSGSSYVSSPPISMSEVTNGVPPMPIYSTASSHIPMLAEPAAPATSHQYLSTYSSPVPMGNQFPNQYAAQPYMYTPDYQAPSASTYPVLVGGSLPTQYGLVEPLTRHETATYTEAGSSRTSMSDPSLLYQSAPAALPMGIPESQGNSNVRVVHSRPKPQCWEHGCNGRQFSTFSNLLRHQREKSGQATKATCPNCGAEFTRTTARNGHLLHDKCRGKRNSRSESVGGNKSE